MKSDKTFFFILAITAIVGLSGIKGWAKDGVLSSVKSGQSNYCHMHFPAMIEGTLSSKNPRLKDASSGDIIHFYGPCDYDPHGKDAVQSQKLDQQRRFRSEYNH